MWCSFQKCINLTATTRHAARNNNKWVPNELSSRYKFSTLTTRQPMVEFHSLMFSRSPLRKKEHKSSFDKNRTHDFRTSRCAGYLLDHSGDGAPIAPARSLTFPLSSLQAILLPGQGISLAAVDVRSEMSQRMSRASGRSVPPMNRLPRSTPTSSSAASGAPRARRLGDQLTRLWKGQSKDWDFGATSPIP